MHQLGIIVIGDAAASPMVAVGVEATWDRTTVARSAQGGRAPLPPVSGEALRRRRSGGVPASHPSFSRGSQWQGRVARPLGASSRAHGVW